MRLKVRSNRRSQAVSATEDDAIAERGASAAPGGAGSTTSWAQDLGQTRCGRDDSAARLAQSRQADAEQATARSLERWVTIVAAIRRLAEAYNAGARRTILNVVEQPGLPTVTVAAGGEGMPYLTATLDDTFVCMEGRDALGVSYGTEFRLLPDRGDDTTATYLLQNWMQRL